MAGIYVHIPFCAKRCNYCSFYSTTCLNKRQAYVDALAIEAELRRSYLENEKIGTVYFGGGTPSVLSVKQIGEIISALEKNFDLSSLKEFTIECNPDDICEDFAKEIANTSVNRLSIGIQSFIDDELSLLGRRHNAEKAVKAVKTVKAAGFDNISIDLMYGLPFQDLHAWNYNVEQALKLDVQHISAYNLSCEEGTPMYKMRKDTADDETAEEMYFILCDKLKEAGFEHYEISNFSIPGKRSMHNEGYWKQKKYIGLGASAHSYDKTSRQWNTADLDIYIKSLSKGYYIFEKEELSPADIYNEYIMTSLRTKEGLDISLLDSGLKDYFKKSARKFIENNKMVSEKTKYYLNENQYFVSDYIIRELMLPV